MAKKKRIDGTQGLGESTPPVLAFTADEVWNEAEAEADGRALMALYSFRRILDHQALSLCVRHFHPLERFFSASERELKHFFADARILRGYVDSAQLVSPRSRDAAWKYSEKLAAALDTKWPGHLLMQHHPRFPRRLLRSRLSVDWIFLHPDRRDYMPRPIVAIVGSRRSSIQQMKAAETIAYAVGAAGGTVVTGLATGADAAAHAAALETEASIVGVLGTGITKVYPNAHTDWVRELIRGRGAVISEQPPDLGGNADAFVLRNRIVATIADVVVAVSGNYASGTSHTVRFASEAAVPVVSVDPALNSGISTLIREVGGYVYVSSEFAQRIESRDFEWE